MSLKKVQNESLVLSIIMILLFLFSQCEPRGADRETIENDNSYEMLEGEDVPPAEEEEETLDSAELSQMKKLQDESVSYERLLDSISESNPNITYTYIPDNDPKEGRIKTVLGDYKVVVDNTLTKEEEETIGVLLARRFNIRQQMLNYYNELQNIDLPARPVEGYPAFYEELQEIIDYPNEAVKLDTEGLVFVQLAVEEDGSISNVKVSENINTKNDELAEAIKEAAVKAVKATEGEWRAAQRDGEPVRSKLEIPVWFDPDTTRS